MANRSVLRIQFTVEDRVFEAVAVLREDEDTITLRTAFERTDDENGGAVGEEDVNFLMERQRLIPEELKKFPLFTKKPDPHNPARVTILHYQPFSWIESLSNTTAPLFSLDGDNMFVLRRVA
jgi:hypothetical protein